MNTEEEKKLEQAAVKCVKAVMKLEYAKQRRFARELNYFKRDCVDKARRRRGYD